MSELEAVVLVAEDSLDGPGAPVRARLFGRGGRRRRAGALRRARDTRPDDIQQHHEGELARLARTDILTNRRYLDGELGRLTARSNRHVAYQAKLAGRSRIAPGS